MNSANPQAVSGLDIVAAAATQSMPLRSVTVDWPHELKLALDQSAIGGITKLTLKEGSWSDHLECLKTSPLSVRQSVRELSLLDLWISTDQLSDLKSVLPNLESLNVGCSAGYPQELASALEAWQEAARATTSYKVTIAKVTLWASGFTGAGPDALPSSLRVLNINGEVNAAELAHLTQLTELRVLYLDGAGPKVLPSSLRVLHTWVGDDSAGLAHLTQLTELRVGSLASAGPKTLPSSLRILQVRYRYDEVSTAGIGRLTQLTELDVPALKRPLLRNFGPNALPASLRVLKVNDGEVSAAELAHLTQLTELTVGFLKQQLLPSFHSNRLPPSLRVLKVNDGKVSAARLAHLTRLTHLEVERLTRAGAKALPSSLQELKVNFGAISAAGLTHLTKLRSLYIRKFTKAGSTSLPSSLQILSICKDRISAADLAHLRATIRTLNLYAYWSRPRPEIDVHLLGGGGGAGG